MFRLMFMLFAVLLGSLWKPEGDGEEGDGDGGSGDGGSGDGDDSGDSGDAGDRGEPGDGEDKPYKVLTFATAEEEQAHYDRTFRERHRRIKKQIKEEIEEELRDEIQAEFAADKSKAEQAASRRKERIQTLEARIEELEEQLETESDTVKSANAERDKYRSVIEEQWNKIAPELPEHITEIISDRDVLDRIAYVNKHREKITASAATQDVENGDGGGQIPGYIIGAPPTPQGTQTRRSKGDEEAQQQFQRDVQHSL